MNMVLSASISRLFIFFFILALVFDGQAGVLAEIALFAFIAVRIAFAFRETTTVNAELIEIAIEIAVAVVNANSAHADLADAQDLFVFAFRIVIAFVDRAGITVATIRVGIAVVNATAILAGLIGIAFGRVVAGRNAITGHASLVCETCNWRVRAASHRITGINRARIAVVAD